MLRKNFPGRKSSRRANALVQQQESYERLRTDFEQRKNLILALPEKDRNRVLLDDEDVAYYSKTFEQNYGTFEKRYGIKNEVNS